MEVLETRAMAAGYRKIVLDTAEPLREAARLYDTSGYTRTEAFNTNPRAAHWFIKELPLDDVGLWGAFQHQTLPASEWHHRTHLRVAWLHLERWPLDQAHLQMRVGIIRLNQAHGLEEAPERGYDETIPRFWLEEIDEKRKVDIRKGTTHDDSELFCAAHSTLIDRALTTRFYRPETLFSLRARSVFVERDLDR